MAESVNAPLYTTEILRLAATLPEPVRLTREDGRSELRSPTCGSRVVVAVQMEGELVEAVSLEVQACAFGQAASSIMARHAPGRTRNDVANALEALRDWLSGRRDDPGDWEELAALTPARSRTSRHGAILLPFRALAMAMDSAA
jgi:NifU-like protein involved in Fe-S cluster formation